MSICLYIYIYIYVYRIISLTSSSLFERPEYVLTCKHLADVLMCERGTTLVVVYLPTRAGEQKMDNVQIQPFQSDFQREFEETQGKRERERERVREREKINNRERETKRA